MAIYNITPQLRRILRDNGVDAEIVFNEADGQFYLRAQGYDNMTGHPLPPLQKRISEADADAMSRWLDMGVGSTNTKAYNTVKRILKEYNLPQSFAMARNARSAVNMGQAWHPNAWFGYPRNNYPNMPREEFGKLYTNYGRSVHGPWGRFPYWMRGGATFPGDRVGPGFMQSYDYRGNMIRPTVGVYFTPDEKDMPKGMPEKIDVKVAPEKPVKAERPEPGQGIPYSEEIRLGSPVYFTTEKFLNVLNSHGIIVNPKDNTVTIKSSNANLDYRIKLKPEEMAKLLNPNAEPPKGVSLEQRLAIINNNADYKAYFQDSITKNMLESKEIIDVSLTEEAYIKNELKFEQYEMYLQQEQMKAEIKREFLANEDRIRQDPNAISGRDIAALMPGSAFLNSRANGRQLIVGEIRVDPSQDMYAININTSEGLKSYPVDKETYEQFTRSANVYDKIRIINNAILNSSDCTEEDRGKYFEARNAIEDLDIEIIPAKEQTRLPEILTIKLNGETVNLPIRDNDYLKLVKDYKLDEAKTAEEKDEVYKNFIKERLDNIARSKDVSLFDNRLWTEKMEFEEKGLSEDYEKIKSMLPTRTLPITIDGKEAKINGIDPIMVKADKDVYYMTAYINGKEVSHAISGKEYQRFIDVNDEKRLEMFDKVFDEVKIGKASVTSQGNPYDVFISDDGRNYVTREQLEIERSNSNNVNGLSLGQENYKKEFRTEGRDGRVKTVEDIRVEPDQQKEGHYKMTAVIDGQSFTHEISQKQYDKFLAMDDYHRMKLFAKVFPEVDMKTKPEFKVNFGTALIAGLTGVTRAAHFIADVGLAMGGPRRHFDGPDFDGPRHPGPRHAPELYASRSEHPEPPMHHTRAAETSAAELASLNFEAANEPEQKQQQSQGMGMGV